MKSIFIAKQLVFAFLVILLTAVCRKIEAATFLSNLGNLWTEGGIGDIHGLFPGGSPYGSDSVYFTTGSGNNFSLNSVTFEFNPSGVSLAEESLSVQLYQQVGFNTSFIGNLGNPVVNPTPTQWPGSTSFIDFSPLGSITLNPLSQYFVVLSMPATSSVDAALLFTLSSTYTTPTDWTLNGTISGNPSAGGEQLVMAVNAAPVPEPCFLAAATLAALLFGVRRSK